MTETTCAKCGESIDAAKITLLREQAEVAEQMEQDELAHLRARLAEVEAERDAYKGRIADADVSIGNLQAAWKKMKAERNAALARADKLAAGVERVREWLRNNKIHPLTVVRMVAADLESALVQSDSRADGETNTKGEQ